MPQRPLFTDHKCLKLSDNDKISHVCTQCVTENDVASAKNDFVSYTEQNLTLSTVVAHVTALME